MAGITGQGYQDAFTAAQNQFNAEQQRQMAAAGQAQQYGIQALGAQRLGGAEQRGIESEGVAADYAQFLRVRGIRVHALIDLRIYSVRHCINPLYLFSAG